MILANITTPLLGLVDTAVLGHMQDSHYLAGAAIAALILTQIYWLCGFLRMSSTGLSAQAKGTGSKQKADSVLCQAVLFGLVIGLVVLLLQQPILQLGVWLAEPNAEVYASIEDYFTVRVWGAPAALVNLALIGWLVGQQATKSVMLLQIAANLLNALLDIVFVFSFGWGVAGVALASVIAEYSICITGLALALYGMQVRFNITHLFSSLAKSRLVSLNSHMLLRNLALQLCLAFLSFQGARLGELTAATNAILMQFFVLIALGLDGIAYGVEALVGEAKGSKREAEIKLITYQGLLWSGVFALLYSITFFAAGEQIIQRLTDQVAIQQTALTYLPLMWLMPVLAHWCFLYDGVYIGLTRAKAMRNSMIFSALGVYFPLWWCLQQYANWGLWLALLAFLLARGVSLGGYFHYLARHRALLD